MEMADFFDTSVDALLGYEVKDNRLSATVERLKRCRYTKDDAGLAEAEKALKKYPNAFAVAYNSGALYRAFGTERGDRALLRRGLELMESAMRLLAQNDDPKISQSTLSGEMAEILLSLGELDQAVELLKKNNAGDLYSDLIGLTLAADCRRPEEALPFLSSALLDRVTDLVRIALGYVNVYFYRKDFVEAKAMLGWILGVLAGVKDGDKPCFADKIAVMFRVCLAYAHLQTGDAEAARRELSMAKATAASYDAAPDPRAGALRFVLDDERAGVYDNLGATCAQTVEKAVSDMESDELYAVVGGSGSGKSTLLHLLMAGSADYRGRILLDGTELREIAPKSLYALMSVIQQNVFVFNASIRENVSMFREFPEEEMERAIRRAHLSELTQRRGEEYRCGENGSGLSGGEKQRVAIARSLLKKSSVLLADEATSALDAQTAHQVAGDLLDLHGMTRILVTHALEESMLRRCDGILVLKNGELVETGSFDELMAKKGYFYALYTVSQ